MVGAIAIAVCGLLSVPGAVAKDFRPGDVLFAAAATACRS
jgi:hypothetical protein